MDDDKEDDRIIATSEYSNRHESNQHESYHNKSHTSAAAETNRTQEDRPLTVSTTIINRIPFGLNRWVLISMFTFVAICIGPSYFNWSKWELILLNNGAYDYKCDGDAPLVPDSSIIQLPDEASCLAQDQAVNSLFPLAVSCMFCCTFIAGWLLDLFGPRLCSVSGMLFLVIAWTLLIFASHNFNSYGAAFPFMGMGADVAFFGTLTIPNLFPDKRSTVISILGGGRAVTSSVPVLMYLAISNSDHITLSTCAILWTCLIVTCMVLCALFLPKRAFKIPSATKRQMQEDNAKNNKTGSAPKDDAFIETDEPASFKDQVKEFLHHVKTPEFILIVPFTIINLIRNNFYNTAANVQMGGVADVLGIVTSVTFLITPVMGYIADKTSVITILTISNTCATLGSLCVTIGLMTSGTATTVLNYVSVFLMYPITGFLLSQLYVYIADTFSQEHLGKLSGLASMIGGLVALVVTPMFNYSTTHEDFLPMNLLIICLSIVAYIILFILWSLKRGLICHRGETTTEIIQSEDDRKVGMNDLA